MTSQHLYKILEEVGLELGYEPNRFGLWSLRKYSISMIVKKFGIYLGTRQAQHSKATGSSVQTTYDQDNGGHDFGAAEMDREAQTIEPGDSLAECRAPSMAKFRKPADVPPDSETWLSEVERN